MKGNQRYSRFWGLPSFLILLVINSVILIFSSNALLDNPRSFGMNAMAFCQKGINHGIHWISESVNAINELKNVKSANQLLLKQLRDYQRMDRNLMEIIRENELLRQQLGFSESLAMDHIAAKIVTRDPEDIFSSFIIDKGSKHGIQKNMPVCAYQDNAIALVGKVIQTGHSSSKILPLYNSTSHIASRFQDSRYEGLISGLGNTENELVMNYVKKTALPHIHLEDMVVSSGMHSLYPEGIVIGTVKSITSRNYDTSLEIRINPMVDFGKLEYLFILTGNRGRE